MNQVHPAMMAVIAADHIREMREDAVRDERARIARRARRARRASRASRARYHAATAGLAGNRAEARCPGAAAAN